MTDARDHHSSKNGRAPIAHRAIIIHQPANRSADVDIINGAINPFNV
jgi:hypothetical protein